MVLRGWESLEELNNNFRFQGEVILGDKFIDEDFDLSGTIIIKLDNGFYSVITRANIEYGIDFNKFEYTFFDIENTLNFIKLNLIFFQSFSYSKIKSILNE